MSGRVGLTIVMMRAASDKVSYIVSELVTALPGRLQRLVDGIKSSAVKLFGQLLSRETLG